MNEEFSDVTLLTGLPKIFKNSHH